MHKILLCKTHPERWPELANGVFFERKDNGLDVLAETYDSGRLEKMLASGRLKHELIFIPAGNRTSEGFRMAQRIKSMRPDARIVLIALEDSCAFEGYRLGAFRCIPGQSMENPQKFIESICAICAELKAEQNFTFRFLEGKKTFSPKRLVYLESRLHKLHFFIYESEIHEYVLYEKLDNIEKMLPEEMFVRAHQSFLVNLAYIRHVEKNYLTLKDNFRIEISRSKSASVREKYANYVEKNPKI